MINNRQNGRRRGRGGGVRTPNNPSNPGNRQDNRSRGNAVQLHEKYKALARDAQLAGDRVQTEYYLQFADHYFRVLSEGRARFEEQRRSRDDFAGDEEGDQEEGFSANEADAESREEPASVRENEQPAEAADTRGEARPRRPRRRRSEGDAENSDSAGEGERISLDSLPPAIAAIDSGDEAPRAPRRRTRRPRSEEGETEIAPAA